MSKFKNCPPVLDSYLRYLELVEARAPATVDARYRDIKSFLQFLRSRCEDAPSAEEIAAGDIFVDQMDAAAVAAVTEEDVEDYLDYLVEEMHLKEQTVYRRKQSSLRMFYDYLLRHQQDLDVVIPRNPVPKGKRGECKTDEPCRALTPSEISKLLKAIEGEAAVRDTAIVLLIATTGLSISEVVKLRYADYREEILLVADRKVYLTEACQKAINRYLFEFRDPISDFLKDNTLFVTRTYRRRLTPRGLQKALQKHFDRAGVKATARDLRYTAVLELMKTARNECERSYIAGYLGYTKLKSLDSLPLPKTDPGDALPRMVENTWLGDLK